MTVFELAVLGLATHQAVMLWFNGGIFVRLAERIGKLHPLAKEGTGCPVCMSVWCGAAVYAAWQVPALHPVVWLLVILDVAGVVARMVR